MIGFIASFEVVMLERTNGIKHQFRSTFVEQHRPAASAQTPSDLQLIIEMSLTRRVASQASRCSCRLVDISCNQSSSTWTGHGLRYASTVKKGAAAPKKKGASFAKKKGTSAGDTGSDSRSESLRKVSCIDGQRRQCGRNQPD